MKDKVIVITGGSSGLGETLAIRFAREKAIIILLARNKTNLKKVANEIKKAGCFVQYYICDITNKNDVITTFEKIKQSFGKIDILINNAGVWLEGNTENATEDNVKNVFNVNIIGMVFVTQEALKIMKISGKGHIVNISSLAGKIPSGKWSIYSSTKFAVRGFTNSLKEELKDTKIRVSGVYPGGINTTLFKNAGILSYKQDEPWMMKKEDIAEIIMFILTRPEDVIIDDINISKNL